MRSAQIKNNIVVNFAEVSKFDDQFIAPLNSVIGSIWNGTSFSHTTDETIPSNVTMRQARLALAAIGLTEAQIDAFFVTAATL